MYVFDTSSFSAIFKFYPKRFPSLWKLFNKLIEDQQVTSVHEVYQELQRRDKDKDILMWISDNKPLFHSPSIEEGLFMREELFKAKNGHFQNLIAEDKRLKGGFCADPFIIARAKIKNHTVITEESYKPNSFKIPYICEHFETPCFNLEKFMEKEGWEF